MIWCLGTPQKFMILGLCVSLQCICLTFFLLKKNLAAGAAGEGDKWQKGPRKILPICPPLPPGCPPLYLTSSSPPSSTHHIYPPPSPPHPPPAPPLFGGLESLHALPPLQQGPVGEALASSSPRFQNIDRFLIIYKLQNNDGYHKTLIFISL